jgi:hypothetical protein
MPNFLEIHTEEQLLPKDLSCGFIRLKSVRNLPISRFVYHRQSNNQVGFSLFGDVGDQAEDALVYVQMYCLPKGAKAFADDYQFYAEDKLKWVRLPDGPKFEPDMLTPRSIPASWNHEAFALRGRSIVHVYQSARLALLLRLVVDSGPMLTNPLCMDALANMRIVENQWDLESPLCQPKRRKPPATDVALPADVKEVRGAIQRGLEYLQLSPAKKDQTG